MNENEMTYHVPVLLHESIDGMGLTEGGIYVDVTFGGGGHSKEILRRMDGTSHLYSFDQDEDAERNIVDDERFTFVRSNFRYLKNFMRYYEVEGVDAILADLGVSSHHFDDAERGFSFRFEGKLDMRMNKRAGMTAAEIVNTYDEERLADLFYLYGELKNSRKLAAALVKARQTQPIQTIGDFTEVVRPFFGREREKKEMAKVFQALRIEVNQEMEALKEMLQAAIEVLKPGGRLVVITYHSLEDRMVKNIMKTGRVDGKAEQDLFGRVKAPLRPLNNKVIVASDEEVARNPRARSAKLRIAVKQEVEQE
jgi:16S rRNA (cytosine1402-N4)-methyltransferase